MDNSPTPMPYEQSPGDGAKKNAAKSWFWQLRDAITAEFEAIEREFDPSSKSVV